MGEHEFKVTRTYISAPGEPPISRDVFVKGVGSLARLLGVVPATVSGYVKRGTLHNLCSDRTKPTGERYIQTVEEVING